MLNEEIQVRKHKHLDYADGSCASVIPSVLNEEKVIIQDSCCGGGHHCPPPANPTTPTNPPKKPVTVYTTDDVPEGEKNLYFTEDRVNAAVKEVNKQQDDAIAQLGVKLGSLETGLNAKADLSEITRVDNDLDQCKSAIANKADAEAVVQGLATKVNTDAFQAAISNTATKSELADTNKDIVNLNRVVSGKADSATVSQLKVEVESKANQTALDSLTNTVDANYNTLNAGKASVDSVNELNNKLKSCQDTIKLLAPNADLESTNTKLDEVTKNLKGLIADTQASLQKGISDNSTKISDLNTKVNNLDIPTRKQIADQIKEGDDSVRSALSELSRGVETFKINTQNQFDKVDTSISTKLRDVTLGYKDADESLRKDISALVEDKVTKGYSGAVTLAKSTYDKAVETAKNHTQEVFTQADSKIIKLEGNVNSQNSVYNIRLTNLETGLQERPTTSSVNLLINSAISAIPKFDTSQFATKDNLEVVNTKLASVQTAVSGKTTPEQVQVIVNTAIAGIPKSDMSQYASKSDLDSVQKQLVSDIGSVQTNLTQIIAANDAKQTTACNNVKDNLTSSLSNIADSMATAVTVTDSKIEQSMQSLDDRLSARINALEAKTVPATTSNNGLLTNADKVKLDGLDNRFNNVATLSDVSKVKTELVQEISSKANSSDLYPYAKTSEVNNLINNCSSNFNNALASQRTVMEDKLDTKLSKTEFESRMGLLSNEMQNTEIENLTKYATIDYVQDQINAVKLPAIDTSNFVTRAEVSSVTDRVTALENKKIDLSGYTTLDTFNTKVGSIDSEISGIKLSYARQDWVTDQIKNQTVATSSSNGLMSAEDKVKLNSLNPEDLATVTALNTTNTNVKNLMSSCSGLDNRVTVLENKQGTNIDLSAYATKDMLDALRNELDDNITTQVNAVDSKLVPATTTSSGFMTGEDKTKLDSCVNINEVLALLQKVFCNEVKDPMGNTIGFVANAEALFPTKN